ncbi:hypothetical protein DMH01_03275 [Amycolatopsis sp. WAC 04182]|uniref:carbohydrate binding domain-containing protein n=1 Tax=Amycolatopsis sp. WAC 04182 TaxID=2203198 RepID=UPI000F7A40F0|nr:carbohydrate binding domain-containing protein [Amycolatopsis sp. WAC 04182]RSN65412.1 hypothetical protein DMH01_03275 [Amycolatopsis sp. WAC 04182]
MAFTDQFVAELAIASEWVDITDDVYGAPGVTITRGVDDEYAKPQPSECRLTLKNTAAGKYAPRNPMGAYYGQLGRNTPFRIARRVARDAFARTVSNGWGAADLGGAWSFEGGTASLYAVSGGSATHSITPASASRMTYQAGQLYRDVDCAVTVSGAPVNVTGGTVEWAIALGGASTSDYYLVIVRVSTSEVVSIEIRHADGSILEKDDFIDMTWTGAPLRIRAQVDGRTIRGKVWLAADPEPYRWHLNTNALDEELAFPSRGWAGVWSAKGAGNTNGAVTFTFDDWEVRSNRFIGEVSSWPNSWDLDGEDVRAGITASSLTRRLGQGEQPQLSSYRRGNESITPAHLAYWPLEDKSGADTIASGIGGFPMQISAGSPRFASNSDFDCSEPIAQSNGSVLWGRIPENTGTGELQAVFLLSIPDSGEVDNGTLLQLQCTGTMGFCDLRYRAGGNLQLWFFNQNRTTVHTSVLMPLDVDGRPLQVSVELAQNGANIDYAVAVLGLGDDIGLVTPGTVAGLSFGSVLNCFAPPYRGTITSAAMGHVAVRNSMTSIYTLQDQLNAWVNDLGNDRARRLCRENGLPYVFIGDTDGVTPEMGPQLPKGFTELLQDVADVDMGMLTDSRSALALVYRWRNTFYNQTPALSLTYQQVLQPFEPTEDDRYLRNDVTVERDDGSSYRAVKETGPLSVTDPTSTAGVGRYATSVSLPLATDEQVMDAAGWLLNLGTVDEPRYPVVKVSVEPFAASTQFALDALSVDVGDRIAITSVPVGLGADDISQIARGYVEFFDGVEHVVDFRCSPESPYQVWELDGTDAARLDSDDSFLAADVTSTATSLVVGSLTTPWTSDPAELPIPVKLGGEKVTVTAVTNEMLSNTTFETGLSPWTSSGTAAGTGFTQSSTQKHSGTFSARLVPDGVTFYAAALSELIPVVAGMPVTVSVWVRFTNAVTSNFSVSINWNDAAGGYITTSNEFVSVSAATWTQVRNTFIAPAGAATAQVVPLLGGTPAPSQVWYVDDVSLTGPQRFTVIRSVNGVVKAHAAGTPISLARPAILAL